MGERGLHHVPAGAEEGDRVPKLVSSHANRCAAIGAALLLGACLSGCGGVDGVALNGAVFDWMGVSESALSKKQSDPKLADRPPLVLPPDANRLPEPGAPATVENGTMSWPTDPEQRKVAEAKERERLHQAYCRGEIGWENKALRPNDPLPAKSPYGSCSALGSILKTN